MTQNTSPIFTAEAVIGAVEISTANTNRDGTGAIEPVVIGATGGTRISRITIKALESTTAGMIRLYVYTGAAYFLLREIPVALTTASASVAAFEYILELFGERAIVLPAGDRIGASTENAEQFNVIAEGGNYTAGT